MVSTINKKPHSNLSVTADMRSKLLISHMDNDHSCDSIGLLLDMLVYSQSDNAYQIKLNEYLHNGSTLALRELTSRFGSYCSDLNFSNRVDAIDSAMLAVLTASSPAATLNKKPVIVF